jgi:L-threonylcarbamoyladenylate synthase
VDTHITDQPEEAAAYIRRGELAAFPTETVYGLGADAFSSEAIQKIFVSKGRPSDNPLIVHIAKVSDIPRLADSISPIAEVLIGHFFPGPLTLVLPRRDAVPDIATAGLPTIGIRMPEHTIAQAFLAAAGTPVVAPSANLSGRPSPTTWEAVAADLSGRIACILKGPQSNAGLESTVIDCTQEQPVVLRPGAVTLEQLRAVVPDILSASSDPTLLARSPGTKYRHYAPQGRVRLVPTPVFIPSERAEAAYIGLDTPPASAFLDPVRICVNTEHYAHELFDFFRLCDSEGIQTIYCQTVEVTGIGRALMDRLSRAAA